MALIKAMNDLLMATDQGQVSVLCLLDMTAAFDTADHGLLLAHLQQCFDIKSSCLTWFTSYLTDRTYCRSGVFTCHPGHVLSTARLRPWAAAFCSVYGKSGRPSGSTQNYTACVLDPCG